MGGTKSGGVRGAAGTKAKGKGLGMKIAGTKTAGKKTELVLRTGNVVSANGKYAGKITKITPLGVWIRPSSAELPRVYPKKGTKFTWIPPTRFV